MKIDVWEYLPKVFGKAAYYDYDYIQQTKCGRGCY